MPARSPSSPTTAATFNGSIDARGGANGGDGGFVDVSSAGQVELNGIVDASAANGNTGTLIIAPKTINVEAAGDLYQPGVNSEFNHNEGGITTISAADINIQIADVLLQANTDININAAIDLSGNPGVGISLHAGRTVNVSASITTDGGNVEIIANDPLAVLAQRDPSSATIALTAPIGAGAGDIDLSIDATGHGDVGDLNIANLTSSGAITVDSTGNIGVGPGINSSGTVSLTADNDVLIDSPLGASTAVTIAAGRGVAINADLLPNGTVDVTANDPAAEAANRQAGPGSITQQTGTGLAGTSVTLTVDATNAADAGGVSIDDIQSAGTVTIASVGAITETAADDEPDIRADIVILSTSEAAAAIGDPGTNSTDPLEILVTTRLDITTNDGPVAIHSPGPLVPGTDPDIDLPLGEINVGVSAFLATVSHGGIIDANAGVGAPNITATNFNLVTQGGDDILAGGLVLGNDGIRGGSIGSSALPIRTDVGSIVASTTHGGIYISETDGAFIATAHAGNLACWLKLALATKWSLTPWTKAASPVPTRSSSLLVAMWW
jgi:hypothetical protein